MPKAKVTPIDDATARKYWDEIDEELGWFMMHPDAFRWRYVQMAFHYSGGNVSATAKRLGMHRRTLQRMLDTKPKERVE